MKMNERKITKFAFGAGLLFLFFRFFYRMPEGSSAAAVRAVQTALAALTVVSDGAPALVVLCRKKRRFGAQAAVFTALYALQAAMLAWYLAGGSPDAPAVVILFTAAALITWQSMILNPPKKGGGKP